MDLPVFLAMRQETVDVSPDEFGVFAVFEDLPDKRVARGEETEFLNGRGPVLRALEAELVVKDGGDLLGACDVERVPRHREDLAFESVSLGPETGADARKLVGIKREPLDFH